MVQGVVAVLEGVLWYCRVYCGTGMCIVVLGLDVLRNGFLCTGYLGALSCVLFTVCFVSL